MNTEKQINKFNVTYPNGDNEDVKIILPIESIKNLRAELDRLEALFSTEGVAAGIFNTYEDLFAFVNDQSKTKYLIGQYLLVKGSDTPELWIAGVEENSEPYEFESDDLVKKELVEEGSIKVGYYRLSSIEPLINTTQVTVNGKYQNSWNADTKLDISLYNEEKIKFLLKEGNNTPFIITPDGSDDRNGAEYGGKYIKIIYPTMGSATQIMYFPEKYVPAEETEETFAMLSDIPEVSYVHSFTLIDAPNVDSFAVWGILSIKKYADYPDVTNELGPYELAEILKDKEIEIPVSGYYGTEPIYAMSSMDGGTFTFFGLGGATYDVSCGAVGTFTDILI